jgi:rubrerythrin
MKMKPGKNMNILEAFVIAIRKEIAANALYSKLAVRTFNPECRKKFLSLAEEEKQHRDSLILLYKKVVGPENFNIPEIELKGHEDPGKTDMTMVEIIEYAIKGEQESAAFYTDLAANQTDKLTVEVLQRLAAMERTHERLLREDLKKVETNPDWFEEKKQH